jgi:peroxiredoxin
MKKILLLLSIATLVYSCTKTEALPLDTYEITVTAKGVMNGLRSYIKNIDEKRNETILDTAIVMNEVFTFTGNINNPAIRVLTINGVNGILPFVLESGKISIEIDKDNISNSKIIGSSNNDDYNLYKTNYFERANTISKIKEQVLTARNENNLTLLNELRGKSKSLKLELNNYAFTFIEEHPDSDLSLLLLETQIIGYNQDIEKLKNSLDVLHKVINRSAANKLIGRKIDAFISLKSAQENLNIGKVAPNFSAPSPEGKIIALNNIKGKATIIDFWASWCKPCRRENPNVVRVYEKYHDKGLEIISVSLDKDGQKERWLKAIKDDNMNWHHVSNLKFWNEPVARLYNINSIPATFILDKDGVIVAKKLRGDALEQKIAELLD